ncbi:hypothetical protein [Pseudomonas sp. HY13-MNA-CIBAN-0226]|uniref:hypothetical protein n=1 Tax=Pseudomonas sp. HY13-MNA-CIBAN-0226 TaxID=3140473 RepID=UPI003331590F
MKLRSYISGLNAAEQVAYAQRCGIAISYLRMHVKYASKDPSIALIRALVRESEGFVSMREVLEHFKLIDVVKSSNAA